MELNPIRYCLFASIALLCPWGSSGFLNLYKSPGCSFSIHSTQRNIEKNEGGWIPLVAVENNLQSPVRKIVTEEGAGDKPQRGSTVEIEYTGTLWGEKHWSSEDVVSCWLSQLQGLSDLTQLFLDKDIDGAMLMDDTRFTEDFCVKELGISNKIKAKKLVMAARRITKQQEEHEPGTVFDSSTARGKNFSFVLGGGKVIKAIDLAVSGMKVGEAAKLVCRSDYAYGSEGLRSAKVKNSERIANHCAQHLQLLIDAIKYY
eukprot:CCRYP_008777-RA/>CCRYP_008777-RA protein AED:0.04 eAED:0.04 QI:227/1/1/1/0/0/2/31/258